MRSLCTVLAVAILAGCAHSRPRTDDSGVERLSLSDERLPLEARRWLADAEDEVAIARAHAEESEADLDRMKGYRRSMIFRLEDSWGTSDDKAAAEGEEATYAFVKYADSRVDLVELELEAAEKIFKLAETRLTQARAETAVRYDLAVYDLEPIVREVERLKEEVAKITREIEEIRAEVDKAADVAWKAFHRYIKAGGVSNSLWGIHDIRDK
jgi:uncharacterized protein (UPF0335 family)